jgi:serine/threonine-protein kinase
MATVYLANDVRHDRQVAIKVLRPELAAVIGADRFLAEIRTTANLQHPHILPLFDSGEADSFLYYVMPFIDGESLREQLDRERQLGVADAVRIAKDVADALNYAHGQGVIHRDIKPANILMHHGRPVVADFGIAVAISAAGGGRMTETGLSLGTPHYMSPEQASADRDLSARSDVYSLGCVLYEMLAGQPPHTGPSAQSVLVRILTDTPRSLSEVRHTVPPHVAATVAKAVEKLPADRFESAKAFMEALDDEAFRYAPAARTDVQSGGGASPASAAQSPADAPSRGLPFWTAAAAAFLALIGGWALHGAVQSPPPPPPTATFEITSDTAHTINSPCCGRAVAVSPAGDRVVYQAVPSNGTDVALFQRPLNQRVGRLIPGTEGARHPFFSPDGEWVGFFSGGVLKKVRFDGGMPLTILTGLTDNAGASWGADGSIVFATREDPGLRRVSSDGGDVTVLTVPDSLQGEVRHRFPHIMPDGRTVLFGVMSMQEDGSADQEIAVMPIAGGEHRIVTPGATPSYVEPGFLVYGEEGGSIMAQPFDAASGEVTGSRFRVTDGGTWRGPGTGLLEYDIARTGTLIYLESGYSAEGRDELVLVDLDEGVEAVMQAGFMRHPRFSPDGRFIAYEAEAATAAEADDVWLWDLQRANSIRVTFERDNSYPVWAPDGEEILYESDAGEDDDGIYRRRADGSGDPEQVEPMIGLTVPYVSPDGRWILVSHFVDGDSDVSILPREDGEGLRPLLDSEFREHSPAVSPDGRWIAYVSDDSGEFEVYVEPFPDLGRRFKVTTGGAVGPVWAPDGSKLYYRQLSPQGQSLVAVDVVAGERFDVGNRVELLPTAAFNQAFNARDFDVHPDGDRFVFVRPGGDGAAAQGGQLHVVITHALNVADAGRD